MIALPVACAPHAALPTLGRGEVAWRVGVAISTGERDLDALYTLETAEVGDGVWRVRTSRTSGTWDDGSGRGTFDSDAPTPADPWPLVLQHTVAAVPADVRVDGGRVTALVDADEWRERARAALYALDLPPEAVETGEPLLDPDGLLADLRRTFPGLPPEGPWERTERIAGVDAVRSETCASEVRGGTRTWTCAGTAAAAGLAARLFEVTTRTSVAADRRGLAWVETAYGGTLLLLAPDGGTVVDRPVAGHRRVERQVAP